MVGGRTHVDDCLADGDDAVDDGHDAAGDGVEEALKLCVGRGVLVVDLHVMSGGWRTQDATAPMFAVGSWESFVRVVDAESDGQIV